MSSLLSDWYPWIKSAHVIAVIAWMAGLFYLPRLFVYHVERAAHGSELDHVFQTMERRLLKAIMNPSMIATWLFGGLLVVTPGIVDWSMTWPWTKAVSVLVLTGFHMWLAKRRRDFERGENKFSGRAYRVANEIPTVALIVIVFSVIVKF